MRDASYRALDTVAPVLLERNPESTMLGYRPDIDGLRAVGVLSVVMFHAFPNLVRGGFVGVDIFFVISGFLICSIIFDKIEKNRFSFVDFYKRRIRRIFPALIVVLIFCSAIGWFILLPVEFSQLGEMISGGAAFVANFVLWHQSGYFDTQAELKPLLHLWSLGVEEQFYGVWPIIAVFTYKLRLNLLVISIAALAASFTYNVWLLSIDPSQDYYSPIARFWEIQIGGALACFSTSRRAPLLAGQTAEATAGVGVLLIAAAAFGLSSSAPFPGWWALVPTLGAALLIAAGPLTLVNRRLLSAKPMIGIGLISYPLYLWHWPLLSLIRIANAGPLPVWSRTLIVLFSIVLAYATYRLVERPLRLGSHRISLVGSLVAAMTVVGGFGLYAVADGGFSHRVIAKAFATADAASKDWEGTTTQILSNDVLFKRFKGKSGKDVVFIGDSHMEQFEPRFEKIYQTDKPNLGSIFATLACAPYSDSHLRGSGGTVDCDWFNKKVIEYAMMPSTVKVVYSAAWNYYVSKKPPNISDRVDEVLGGLCKQISAMAAARKQVFVVLSTPEESSLDPQVAMGRRFKYLFAHSTASRFRTVSIGRSELATIIQWTNDKVRSMSEQCGATVINPLDFLCTSDSCPGSLNGLPIYCDASHLRSSYVKNEVKFLDSIVD